MLLEGKGGGSGLCDTQMWLAGTGVSPGTEGLGWSASLATAASWCLHPLMSAPWKTVPSGVCLHFSSPQALCPRSPSFPHIFTHILPLGILPGRDQTEATWTENLQYLKSVSLRKEADFFVRFLIIIPPAPKEYRVNWLRTTMYTWPEVWNWMWDTLYHHKATCLFLKTRDRSMYPLYTEDCWSIHEARG